jgi:hypothetical protein
MADKLSTQKQEEYERAKVGNTLIVIAERGKGAGPE